MNLLQVAGHLGAAPEERFTSGGQKVITLRLASHSRKGGADVTLWWRVTIWGDRFDKMLPYLKKGSPLIVIGEMSKPEIYTDKEGKPQVSLDLVADMIRFSPFGRGGNNEGSKNEGFAGASATQESSNEKPPMNPNEIDDEIPF